MICYPVSHLIEHAAPAEPDPQAAEWNASGGARIDGTVELIEPDDHHTSRRARCAVSGRGLPWTDLRPGGDGFAGFPVPRDLGMYLPRCVADKPK